MKILTVNTYDYGGAANACKRLHVGLIEAGIDSKLLLKNKQNDWLESYQFEPLEQASTYPEKFKRKIRRLAQELKLYGRKEKVSFEEQFINIRREGLEMFSFPHSHLDITESELYNEADIINLHWVANFLDLESFFSNNKKPVVWTLHDMNPFTGGEHYEEKFLGLNDKGQPLARKYSKEELKVSEKIRDFKKKLFSQVDNLHIVTPSKWLKEEVTDSEVFGKSIVEHIPYGLDGKIFRDLDQNFSRDLLGIPREKKVVLFVADSLKNKRKGFIYLKEAFRKIQHKDLFLCAVGNTDSGIRSDSIVELGPIKDERLMSAVYSAADVFVIPSLIDNLPNTVLESLMCGTPVIGFPVGGIPDMVAHEENGLLTEEISVNDLVITLNSFLADPERFDRNKIRLNAIKKYDLEIQAKKYYELYRKILNNDYKE